jgi:hypothetical protein
MPVPSSSRVPPPSLGLSRRPVRVAAVAALCLVGILALGGCSPASPAGSGASSTSSAAGSPSDTTAPRPSSTAASSTVVTSTTAVTRTTAVRPTTTTAAPGRPPAAPADVPMPNPRLTPGAVQSSDTGAICTPGWAEAHRDVSWQTKDAVAAEYGLSSRYGYEIDHLIPLELGGANTVANLWPEPYGSPYGAIEKDGLEDWLHEQVCNGALALGTAQHEIATNWYAAWLAAGKPMPSWFGYSNSPPYGSGGSGSGGSGGSGSGGPPPTTSPGGGGGGGAWCTASAAPSNDGYPGDYEVYVHSNQPDTSATASDSSDKWSDYTNSSGYAEIRLYHQSSGESITVTVGSARCTTSA